MSHDRNATDTNTIDDFNADAISSSRTKRQRRAPRRYADNPVQPDEVDDLNYVPSPQKRDKFTYDDIPYANTDDFTGEPIAEEPVEEEKPAKAPTRRKKAPATRRKSEQTDVDKDAESSFSRGIRQFFADGRFRIFSGVVFILLSVVIGIVTYSHISNGAADQSIVTNTSVSQIADGNAPAPANVGGAVGAWFAHVLFTESLGLGSVLITVYFLLLGFSLLRLKHFSFWSLSFKCILTAITVSVVLGLFTYMNPGEIYLGGTHGYYVNHFLITHGNYLLAIFVSLVLVAAVVCVFINDIVRFSRIVASKMKQRRERMAALRQSSKSDDVLNDTADSDSQTKLNNTPIDKTDDGDNDATDKAADAHHPTHETSRTLVNLDELLGNTDDDDALTIEKPVETDGYAAHTDEKAEEQPGDDLLIDIDGPGFEVTTNEIEQADSPGKTTLPKVSSGEFDPRADLSRFRMPSIDLLSGSDVTNVIDEEEQQENKEVIIRTLQTYNIPIKRIEATVGPTVTLYEIVPEDGVRIASIKKLEDDIAMSLKALGIRIIAPIPGKGTIGFEVPNREPQTVSMRSIIASKAYQETKAKLPLAMGATISKEILIEDLTKMPHLLVAGGSGTGKSVGLNVIIASLIYKKHPAELKFVLVDPKMVEFSLYEKLERHYLAKLPDEERAIITDPNKALLTLNSLCVEMDQRYALLSNAMVRTVEDYNKKFCQRQLNPEKGHRYMPYIVIIVDEFADLIMTAGKEVYTSIARLAQKARAVGMHVIIATQRPSTDVITGVIKANFLGRIAFKVSNMVDSKTILDRTGANNLIGRGDMLFSLNGRFERVQCAFMSTEDVEALTDDIDSQVGYEHAYYLPEWSPEGSGVTAGASTDRDPLFDESARFIITQSSASTSSLQRRYSIGYNRASRIMDQMEAAGIVGPASGAKPRNILVDSITLERILGN